MASDILKFTKKQLKDMLPIERDLLNTFALQYYRHSKDRGVSIKSVRTNSPYKPIMRHMWTEDYPKVIASLQVVADLAAKSGDAFATYFFLNIADIFGILYKAQLQENYQKNDSKS